MTLSDGKKASYQADRSSNDEEAPLLEAADAPGPPPYPGAGSSAQYRALEINAPVEPERPASIDTIDTLEPEELPPPPAFSADTKGLRLRRLLLFSALSAFLGLLCWIMAANLTGDGDVVPGFPVSVPPLSNIRVNLTQRALSPFPLDHRLPVPTPSSPA